MATNTKFKKNICASLKIEIKLTIEQQQQQQQSEINIEGVLESLGVCVLCLYRKYYILDGTTSKIFANVFQSFYTLFCRLIQILLAFKSCDYYLN